MRNDGILGLGVININSNTQIFAVIADVFSYVSLMNSIHISMILIISASLNCGKRFHFTYRMIRVRCSGQWVFRDQLLSGWNIVIWEWRTLTLTTE